MRTRGTSDRAARLGDDRPWRKLVRDQRGVAALEFALMAGTFIMGMLSTVDVARWYYDRMEVENAAQAGAQAAWSTCDTTELPATTNCPGFNSAVTSSVQSTSLGTSVSLRSGSPSEGYYCVDTNGVLQYVSGVSSRPSNCSSVGSASDQPGDYVKIETTFTYAPLFTGISIGGLLPTSITANSMMRLQ